MRALVLTQSEFMPVLRHKSVAVRHVQSSAGSRCSCPAAPSQLTTCSAGGKGRRRAQRPGQFEVQVKSPPVKSLGVHLLPPSTHNGDLIEVAGQDYIVDSLVIQYKLVKGRYERSHHRLDVLSTSRYLLNRNLESAFRAPDADAGS